jgi:hypothetical protein
MSRPGANITGVCFLDVELGPKRLELLHQLVPKANVGAALVNPTEPTRAETTSRGLQAAARSLGLQLHVLHASAEHDFDAVLARLIQLRAGGIVIGGILSSIAGANSSGKLRRIDRAAPRIFTVARQAKSPSASCEEKI